MNNNKQLPRAEEFLKKEVDKNYYDILKHYFACNEIEDIMIEFTKLHVKAALKAASEQAELTYDQLDEGIAYENQSAILNAYPLRNIK